MSGRQNKILANEPKYWQTNQNADKQPNLKKQNNLFKSLEARVLLIALKNPYHFKWKFENNTSEHN